MKASWRDAVTGSAACRAKAAATSWSSIPITIRGSTPKVEEYNYKFLGEKNMLGRRSRDTFSPSDLFHRRRWQRVSGGLGNAAHVRRRSDAAPFPRLRRRCNRRRSSTSTAKSGSRLYEDSYDPTGRLWQNHIYWLTFRDRPVPDAKAGHLSIQALFRGRGCGHRYIPEWWRCAICRARDTPEHECWYINMGAVGRDFFTTDSMVRTPAP